MTISTYFAEIDSNEEVLRVIVADQSFINSDAVGNLANWVETKIEGGERKNYAGIGHKYDKKLDAFIPPKPHASWILDEVVANWKAPIEKPIDKVPHKWDEATLNWQIDTQLIAVREAINIKPN